MTTATTASEHRWGAKDGKDAQEPGGGQGSKSKTPDGKGKKGSKKGSKKKLIIILVAVLAVGGGAYKFLVPKKPGPPVGGVVIPIDATTLNLTDGHYLKIAVGVQLVAGKATAESFATSQASELIIDEFANRSVESLSTNAARKKLTVQLVAKVKKAYKGEVFDVFITQFVTQ